MTFNPILDVVAYSAVMAILLRQPRLADLLRALKPLRRVALLFLLLAIPAGQVIHQSGMTYPWVAWAMYTDPRPGDVTYLDYTLVLADGREVELPVARMFSRMGKKVVWRLKGLEREGQLTVCDRILGELAQRYNREHAANPAVSIRIWDCVVPISTDPTVPPPSRTPRRAISL